MLKQRFILYILMVVALTAFGPGLGSKSMVAVARSAALPAEDVQVLSSGPIHEAFAEAVALDPEPGIEAPRKPPALIEEIPPDERPDGDVQWIQGYWGWDDDRDDYIWVSGIWRVMPPDRQWVPGYWYRVTNGYQWISGYWASEGESETAYLPEPPETIEVGPSSDVPSADYIWVPGCWRWMGGRYAWGPGYWAAVRPNWIWVPSHYNWTPRGYIFVSGYWDYRVTHRGVLFAPVFFPSRFHLGLAFSFSPAIVINLGIFDDALFLRPRYRHYYYGDYYATRHYRRGIYPWFSPHARRGVYDPIFAHQRWHHRHDRGWENHLEASFQKRRGHKASRPQPVLDHRTRSGKVVRSTGSKRPGFVHPPDRAEKNSAGSKRFAPPNQQRRGDVAQRQKPVRTELKENQRRETRQEQMPAERVTRQTVPGKENASRPPRVDRPNKTAGRQKDPPVRYRQQRQNPKIEPLKRASKMPRSLEWSQNRTDRGQRAKVWNSKTRQEFQGPRNRGDRAQVLRQGGHGRRWE